MRFFYYALIMHQKSFIMILLAFYLLHCTKNEEILNGKLHFLCRVNFARSLYKVVYLHICNILCFYLFDFNNFDVQTNNALRNTNAVSNSLWNKRMNEQNLYIADERSKVCIFYGNLFLQYRKISIIFNSLFSYKYFWKHFYFQVKYADQKWETVWCELKNKIFGIRNFR